MLQFGYLGIVQQINDIRNAFLVEQKYRNHNTCMNVSKERVPSACSDIAN